MAYKSFPCGCKLNMALGLGVSVNRCPEAYALWEKFREVAYDDTRFRSDEAGKQAQAAYLQAEEAYYAHTGRPRAKTLT